VSASRPAFYALEPGGWRDYLTLLHPPYTLWHLSYVAIGAALAPHFEVDRLLVALAAFFLAVGIGAHALDELKGHPLQTRISDRTLVWLSAVSIGGAVTLGIYGSIAYTPWLAPLVAVGAFVVVAYNLELFGGAFHTAFWLCAAWAAFPVLTAYFASARTISGAAVAAAAYAFALIWVQRTLSTPARAVRRKPASEVTDAERAIAPHAERALQVLAAAAVLIAAALLLARA
jgi:ABC-type uncharacterized transport system permease subunit